jgi:hypothetical protein
MIELPFTEEMKVTAEERAEEMGKLNNSILEGRGTPAGFLSEEAFLNYFPDSKLVPQTGTQKYKFDIMFRDLKCELKTIRRTVKPSLGYECSIAKTSTHQKPDMYIFLSIEYRDKNKLIPKAVWLLGWISKEDFYKKAKFLTKGTIDLDNNHVVSQDKYNIQIWRLKDILKKEFQTNDDIDWN